MLAALQLEAACVSFPILQRKRHVPRVFESWHISYPSPRIMLQGALHCRQEEQHLLGVRFADERSH